MESHFEAEVHSQSGHHPELKLRAAAKRGKRQQQQSRHVFSRRNTHTGPYQCCGTVVEYLAVLVCLEVWKCNLRVRGESARRIRFNSSALRTAHRAETAASAFRRKPWSRPDTSMSSTSCLLSMGSWLAKFAKKRSTS